MFNLKFKSLAVAALISLALGCSGGKERQAEYFSKAQALFDQGNVVKARVEVRNALQIDANYPDARYLLALIYEREKNWQQMFANLRLVVELDSGHIGGNIKLAQMYYANRAYPQTLEHVEAVLQLEPNNPDAHMLKGSVFFRNGEHDEAIREAHLALNQQPGHVGAISVLTEVYKAEDPERALAIIGDGIDKQSQNATLKLLKIDVLETQGDIDGAIEVYQQLAQEYPENLLFHYRLVNLLEKHNRIDEAESVLRNIVKSKPENVKLKLWLAQFLSGQRDLELAKTTLQAFIQRQPDVVEFPLALAKVYVALKDFDSAKTIYRRIVADYEGGAESLSARNRLVALALAQNNRQEAETLLNEILALEDENSEALLTRAKLALADNDTKTAITSLRIVVKNQSKPIEALTLLAKAHQNVGALDLALDNYRQLISVEPDNSSALSGAAGIELSLGNLDEAENLLNLALKLDPDNLDATRMLVAAYSNQQRWEQGMAKAELLISQPQSQALGYYLKGRLSLAQEDFEAATTAFKQTLTIESRVIEALKGLVQAYRNKGEHAAATAYVEGHIEQFPDQIHAYELLAGLYRAENPSKAIEVYQQAIEISPQSGSLYRGMGATYAGVGMPEKALETYRQGLDVNADDIALLLLSAAQLKDLQQYAQSEQLYKQVLAIDPDSVIAANNLAMLYADYLESPKNLDTALELTRKLNGIRQPVFLDTLGWVNYKLGRYQSAISYFQSAIELDQSNGVLHYHLAKAYLGEGKPELAKAQSELALTKGIGANNEAELRGLLAEL